MGKPACRRSDSEIAKLKWRLPVSEARLNTKAGETLVDGGLGDDPQIAPTDDSNALAATSPVTHGRLTAWDPRLNPIV
jgi:hypothetical protein